VPSLALAAVLLAGCALFPQERELPARLDGPTVTVSAGDTLAEIAARYGVPVDALVALNGLSDGDALAPGTTLVLPPARDYEVRPSDTLSAIAGRFGVPFPELAALNDRSRPYTIYIGETLRVPVATDPSGVARPLPPQRRAAPAPEPTQTAVAVPGPPPDEDGEAGDDAEADADAGAADGTGDAEAADGTGDADAEAGDDAGKAVAPNAHDDPADDRPSRVVLDTIVGYDETTVTELLGAPDSSEDDPPARVWQYASENCVLDVYFYMELSTRNYRVLSYELDSAHDTPDVEQQCITELVDAGRSSGGPAGTGRPGG
jgi:LysM repeat protein